MTRELRDYQAEAVQAVRDEWGRGVRRTAVVLPTGAGKTDVIAKIATDAASFRRNVLAIAHRDELIRQIAERCAMHDARIPVGIVKGERTQRMHRITVASSQTLGMRLGRLAKADAAEDRRAAERLARRLPVRPDVVIVDECHHAASDSYLAALRWAGCYGDGDTVAMGVTATLVRGDRRGLGDVWETVAYARDIAWAIGRGILVRPRGKVVVIDHLDLARAKVTAGDYQDGELGEMVAQDTDQIVKAWAEHAAERLTIAFTPTVASAEALCAEFVGAGVAAAVVTGATGTAERQRLYADLAAGRIRVLCSVSVLTEGWDSPPVSCVLMARPTRLPGLYQQIVGRGLRLAPGKTDCLVLDVVGASRVQRLTTLIDLSPSSEYDTSALDALPCETCGLPVRAADPAEPVCQCPPELGERDPDGGRRRLLGPAVYEDLDLLLTTSPFTWLQTYAGTPILPAGRRCALLWRNPDTDRYWAGHMNTRGVKDGQWLAREVTLDEARQLAEAWAADAGGTLAERGASWRRPGAPSPAQLEHARRLGILGAEKMTKARLSDEITVALMSGRIDR